MGKDYKILFFNNNDISQATIYKDCKKALEKLGHEVMKISSFSENSEIYDLSVTSRCKKEVLFDSFR